MKKIIFDCDNTMGIEGCDVDDGLALLYLLGKENVEVCGITSTYGNSDIETVYSNTLKMLKELGREDIPLLLGCENRYALSSKASDFIIDTVNLHKGNISILATGSLTNLYASYLKDNTIFEKVSEIVLMGGITEPLIINSHILDELNFSCDPKAAECALKKGRNVSVITGNNCLDAFFTKHEFNQRLLCSDKPAAKYIAEKCMYWFDNMMSIFNIEGFHNWDVVAAAFIANPLLFNNDLQYITPDLKGLEKGMINGNSSEIELPCPVNIPIIGDLDIFTDDVYNTWLELKLNS